MRIETMRLDRINPAPYNPRRKLKPGDADYERIKRSLDEFGLVEPLVFNQRTGHLVGGHQRYQILTDRGEEEAPVSIVDLDPAAEKALNIALNKAQGEWDQQALNLLLAELAQLGLADAAGFNSQEIDDLLLKLEIDSAPAADYEKLMSPAVERPDQAPENERITVTLKAGPDVLTPKLQKEIRTNYSHLGIEITVQEGGQ